MRPPESTECNLQCSRLLISNMVSLIPLTGDDANALQLTERTEYPALRSSLTMRQTNKAIAVCVGIGQCEDVCSHGQLPWKLFKQASSYLSRKSTSVSFSRVIEDIAACVIRAARRSREKY